MNESDSGSLSLSGISGFVCINDQITEYQLVGVGVDSLSIAFENGVARGFRSAFEKWRWFKRKGKGKSTHTIWLGPKLPKGLSVEYKKFHFVPYEALYILIQPDHLLGQDLEPARGELLIKALETASKELSRWFGPITLEMLLHARLKSLEICWDFRDLWFHYLIDLPLKFKRNGEYKSGLESSSSERLKSNSQQECDVGLKQYTRDCGWRMCDVLYEN
ncbi:hypothetical protein CEE37_14485 [candidate division LCP-89 bacterium B3_LCP]|uniref:Uncharacterized protein n=1 Tax=candidate division LCP-89 bacterium B3_LCP TaxID=2012998 RepID=A0A532UPQ9_UNCL8|nr:MAG: hypothetical protein CEE37_14485 [candidate division LCP-89 bacterium B3_LCP]